MKEPLNIISESVRSVSFGGPEKVIRNTLKGLDRIGYPYVINKDPREFRFNWVHDSVRGLIEISLLKIPAVIGPNIAVLPSNLPRLRPKLSRCIYLHPSLWCIDLWRIYEFDECPMLPWPAGIDTDDFHVARGPESAGRVMIYYKRRNPTLLDFAVAEVRKMGLEPVTIKYSEYKSEQYKELLSKVQFGVWIGISESQGIGLQEALSTDLPLIVYDVNSLFESADPKDYKFDKRLKDFKPTSVPYFDNKCGIIINDISELGDAINHMIKDLDTFRPRKYIESTLSLEKQANELLSFFEILMKKDSTFFSMPLEKKGGSSFNISFKGRIIYYLFISKRKMITLRKLLARDIKKIFQKK